MKAHDWFTTGSLVAGFIGIGYTFWDVFGAIRRLKTYLRRTTTIHVSAHDTARATLDAALARSPEPTLEERVKSIEVAIPALRDEIRTGDEQLAEALATQIRQATSDVQQTVRGEIDGLRAFVVDGWPNGIWAYRGPALVVISLVLAALGEIASLTQN